MSPRDNLAFSDNRVDTEYDLASEAKLLSERANEKSKEADRMFELRDPRAPSVMREAKELERQAREVTAKALIASTFKKHELSPSFKHGNTDTAGVLEYLAQRVGSMAGMMWTVVGNFGDQSDLSCEEE